VVLPLWVVENRLSPLLWPLAYTTACTTVQAVIAWGIGKFVLKFSRKKVDGVLGDREG